MVPKEYQRVQQNIKGISNNSKKSQKNIEVSKKHNESKKKSKGIKKYEEFQRTLRYTLKSTSRILKRVFKIS